MGDVGRTTTNKRRIKDDSGLWGYFAVRQISFVHHISAMQCVTPADCP